MKLKKRVAGELLNILRARKGNVTFVPNRTQKLNDIKHLQSQVHIFYRYFSKQSLSHFILIRPSKSFRDWGKEIFTILFSKLRADNLASMFQTLYFTSKQQDFISLTKRLSGGQQVFGQEHTDVQNFLNKL